MANPKEKGCQPDLKQKKNDPLNPRRGSLRQLNKREGSIDHFQVVYKFGPKTKAPPSATSHEEVKIFIQDKTHLVRTSYTFGALFKKCTKNPNQVTLSLPDGRERVNILSIQCG